MFGPCGFDVLSIVFEEDAAMQDVFAFGGAEAAMEFFGVSPGRGFEAQVGTGGIDPVAVCAICRHERVKPG